MKINEVIVEALNTDTGTPNPSVFKPNPARTIPHPKLQQKPTLWNKIKAGAKSFVQPDAQDTQNTKTEVTAQRSSQPWIRLWNSKIAKNPSLAQNPTELLAFAKTIFGNRIPVDQIPAPTDMSSAGVSQYITKLTDTFMQTPILKQTQTPGAQDQPTKSSRLLDPEVDVISARNPIVLKFNGKRYTRQPNGEWSKLGQTKPIDLPMQQFLNKELAKL